MTRFLLLSIITLTLLPGCGGGTKELIVGRWQWTDGGSEVNVFPQPSGGWGRIVTWDKDGENELPAHTKVYSFGGGSSLHWKDTSGMFQFEETVEVSVTKDELRIVDVTGKEGVAKRLGPPRDRERGLVTAVENGKVNFTPIKHKPEFQKGSSRFLSVLDGVNVMAGAKFRKENGKPLVIEGGLKHAIFTNIPDDGVEVVLTIEDGKIAELVVVGLPEKMRDLLGAK